MKTTHFIFFGIILFLTSCKNKVSNTTGWEYNNPSNGGFQKVPYVEQETGPGLILVQGGCFDIALKDQDTIKDFVVPSFYIDQTEITNKDWWEYLYWTSRVFGNDFKTVYYNALPDTNVWRIDVGLSAGFENNYLRHPAYQNYPVVGVNWMQANNYCAWRTDRVNEHILIREGVLIHNPFQQNEPFTTDAYAFGQYISGLNPKGQIADLDPSKGGYNPSNGKVQSKYFATRNVRWSDGILLPRYRLLTEVEWEFASSKTVTSDSQKKFKKHQKLLQSQFDLMGDFIRNESNVTFQNGTSISSVKSYLPNDLGVFNLAGNVSEWVQDVYIERSEENYKKYAPYIGEPAKVPVSNFNMYIDNKYEEVIYDINGMSNYLSNFKNQRLKNNQCDSIDLMLFNKIEEFLTMAQKSYEIKDFEEVNFYVRNIFDNALNDFIYKIQNEYNLPYYKSEISPMLYVGFSRFIIDTPGNIKFRDLTPEEHIRNRNNLNGSFSKYQVFNAQLDSLVKHNDNRVVKGGSWMDDEVWKNPFYRKSMDKFESSCTVGLRCAMDRVGSPYGLSKAKKLKKESKIDL